MATVMLIDGNSLTYRAFFALPTDMSTAAGQVTNAVFGFTSMLLNLVRDHRPDRVVLTFDLPQPTFRHEKVETYKANRDAAPDILRQQMGLVRQVVDTLALPVVTAPGYEADDVIATLAERAVEAGDEVVIVTGDRDSYQLVRDPQVRVLYNKRGVSDYVMYDEAGIEARTGVRPDQYVWYAALRGDPSDNLPGVPKVGEKTAAKLVTSYGDLDGIFAHASEQTPALSKNLAEHEDRARTNVEMMRLVRDVPLDVTPSDLLQGEVDADAVLELFRFLEFPSLVPRLTEAFPTVFGDGVDVEPVEVLEAELVAAETPAELTGVLDGLAAAGSVAVAAAWSGEPGRSAIEGLALVTDVELCEVLWVPAGLLGELTVQLDAVLNGRPDVAAHDAKPIVRSLLESGLAIDSLRLDTKLAAYLLDPADAVYGLPELLRRHVGLELAAESGAAEGQLDFSGAAVDASLRAAREALAVARLVDPLREALVANGVGRLNDEVEVPLVGVLARMEHLGVGVDIEVLAELNRSLTTEAEAERAAIVAAAGEEVNVNSTPQMRALLFDKLGLTPGKKTKTGYSTDQATLEKLRGEHPIIEHLLRYREVEKLRSTYGEGLMAEVAADGRIHATFNQTVARTGRLSSDAPNLHNIPVRTDEGRRFREAFVPAEGHEFLVADYNQIELRVIAHLAEDPGLIEAFTAGEDIHATTAARIFGCQARRGHRGAAFEVQDGLLRARLRHGGLRPRPTPRHPHRRGPGDPRRLLRGVPEREGVHGAHRRSGSRAGLHRDRLRSAPADPRVVLRTAQRAHGGRTPGDERSDPGPGCGHLQGGARPPRRRARPPPPRRTHRPAGPRRGHPRGGTGRAGRRRRGRAARHVGSVRPAGPARGEPVPR